ncbi:hydantoinase B/oxoprolinase family protein [Ramlibacter sp. AN1133]|uniref:hydantoinase B/oxoprolinase family protein n=1 Tax=Ramlibacter sp. AN1133 TaxID=3133429 RepID=UPI0030C4C6FF
MSTTFPPYLLEILWNRLLALAEEQAQVLMRTAFSTIVREAGDLSAAIFDRRGRMVAQARTGTPGHVNTMARGMRHFLAEFPLETIEPGDALLSNDPYKLAGQLNDMCLVTPAFHRGSLVGFFASCCHMVDIGGVGLTADARNVFEEGLQVPFCKFLVRGEKNRDVFRFIETNVRTPREVIGDLYAQVAAGEVGSRRLTQLLEEFELADIEDLSDEIVDRSHAAVREAVRAFPEDRYVFSAQNDGFEKPLHVQVEIFKEGEQLVVDFAGTDPSVDRGINVPLAYTTAYSSYAVKCVVAPDVPNNEGSFLPIVVRAPVGSLLNPVHPSPTAARHIVGQFLPTVVFGALEQAMPAKVPADSAAGLWVTQVSGIRQDDQPFSFAFFSCGGMGARQTKDGLAATSFPSGIQNVATEVIEASSPIVMRQRELRADSGGAGRYRGGLGQSIRFEVRSKGPWILSGMYDRIKFAPRGTQGGADGAAGSVMSADGQALPAKGRVTLAPAVQVVLELPGGGGAGDPRERTRAAVERDMAEGYVTQERANEWYGDLVRR